MALPASPGDDGDGDFDRSTSSESRCTSIAPLIVAAAADVTSTGAGREDPPKQARRRGEPELRGRLRHLAGHGGDGGDRGHVRGQRPGRSRRRPRRLRWPVAAAATAIMAPARISRLASSSSPSPTPLGAPLRAATAATTAAARIDGSYSHRRLQRPSRGFGLVPRARGPHANGSLDSRVRQTRSRIPRRRISEQSRSRRSREQARDGSRGRPREQLDVHLAAVCARRDVPPANPQGPAAPSPRWRL